METWIYWTSELLWGNLELLYLSSWTLPTRLEFLWKVGVTRLEFSWKLSTRLAFSWKLGVTRLEFQWKL